MDKYLRNANTMYFFTDFLRISVVIFVNMLQILL